MRKVLFATGVSFLALYGTALRADEALDTLDADAGQRLTSLYKERLQGAAIINIGQPETKNHFFTRLLHLVRDAEGRCFIPHAGLSK